jgi:glycosyltransferase involved in cell wall biosynthesis
MGRLEVEKGFDRLIEAFQLVAQDCPGWKLLIVGEGSLRPKLERLVSSLGLEGCVDLPGRVGNPRTLFARCDLFVMSSHSEGFGLALVEAMSAGLPAISFDCDFGPREIIQPGRSGMLVRAGDVPALAQAIAGLVKDGPLRARLACAAMTSTVRFAPEQTLAEWEALLRRVATGRSAAPEAAPATEACEGS